MKKSIFTLIKMKINQIFILNQNENNKNRVREII